MFKIMKMSKYNFITNDNQGNLIVYNFLTGISSLTKVVKPDIDKFTQLFLTDAEIYSTFCKEYAETVESLLKSGILVSGDTDESALLESRHYDEVYDSKLFLTILPTGKCNFSCPYCFETPQPFHREAMTIDAQNALLKFVQRSIPNHKGIQVNWFGGEPLLEPEIIEYLSNELIRICNKRYLPYSAEMTTNGYFLNADMFDMLYKLKVYNYMITIDGFKEQHDKRRILRNGMGSYDIIMGNLLRIRDSKQYKFARIIVRINVSDGFFDKFDDFVHFITVTFSDDPRFEVRFEPVILDPKETDFDIFVDPGELSSRLSKNEEYKSKLINDKTKLSSIVLEPKCIAANKNAYVITPDLSVYKCCSHFEYDINQVGSINLKGDLLVNETLHKRWYLMNKYIQKLPKSCNNCFYLPCCRISNPGCPLRYNQKNFRVSCNIKDEKFKQDLTEAILYAAHKNPCTVLAL